MTNPLLELQDDWKALGLVQSRKPKASPVEPFKPSSVWEWLSSTGQTNSSFLCVWGTSPQERGGTYNDLAAGPWALERHSTREWLWGDVLEDFTQKARRIRLSENYAGKAPRTSSWEWLWGLAHTDVLCIEEPLRGMADNPHHLVHRVMLSVMNARFKVLEGESLETLGATIQAITQWITMRDLTPEQEVILEEAGVNRPLFSESERVDCLMFLLGLAYQNGLIQKQVFVYDDLETVCGESDRNKLRSLHGLLQAVRRWKNLTEIPVRFLVGLELSSFPLLRRLCPKFAADVWGAISFVRGSP